MTQEQMSGSQMEELQLFYEEVKRYQSRPLWVGRTEPQPKAVPYLWKYQDFRPLLLRAAELVPMEMAERRVLIFSNPGLSGRGPATSTLSANLQIINPGEVAPSHRHTASALRLIVEGHSAYTAVEGEKTYMEPGDFITTPNWTWHDHGNEGDAPMVWLDGLDSTLVGALDAAFREEYPEESQPLTKSDEISQRLFAAGSLRPTWVSRGGLHSPLINYKFAQTYDALSRLSRETEGSPFDGICLEYTTPRPAAPPWRRWPATPRSSRPARTLVHIGTQAASCTTLSPAAATPSSTACDTTGAPRTPSWCRRGPTTSTSPARSRWSSGIPTPLSSSLWASIASSHTRKTAATSRCRATSRP